MQKEEIKAITTSISCGLEETIIAGRSFSVVRSVKGKRKGDKDNITSLKANSRGVNQLPSHLERCKYPRQDGQGIYNFQLAQLSQQ